MLQMKPERRQTMTCLQFQTMKVELELYSEGSGEPWKVLGGYLGKRKAKSYLREINLVI